MTNRFDLHKLRLMSAIVLMCAIALPLSECSQGGAPSPPATKSPSQRLFPQDNGDLHYSYGYQYVDLSPAGAIAVLAFTWPLIFVLFLRRRGGFRLRLFLQVVEVLLCAGTIYMIIAYAPGERWLYGFYVGVIAVAVFTGAGLASCFLERKSPAGRESG